MNEIKKTSPTKQPRRKKAEIAAIKTGLYQILEQDHPMTVRGVFYQAVSHGLVPKTEASYRATVDRLLVQMRERNELPYYWITDNGRWMRKPETHSSLESMLYQSQRMYRRALWDDQPDYVEIWIEKDAISGIFYDITSKWDVPLMVTRGYPSLSFLYEAADTIDGTGKPAYHLLFR